ncbi:MAG: hypothetical protein ACK40U_04845, partial [Fervidobacterium pennivorans]
MRKAINTIIVIILLISSLVISAEYTVRIENMELGKIKTQYTKNGWSSVSEIKYGEKYVVET